MWSAIPFVIVNQAHPINPVAITDDDPPPLPPDDEEVELKPPARVISQIKASFQPALTRDSPFIKTGADSKPLFTPPFGPPPLPLPLPLPLPRAQQH